MTSAISENRIPYALEPLHAALFLVSRSVRSSAEAFRLFLHHRCTAPGSDLVRSNRVLFSLHMIAEDRFAREANQQPKQILNGRLTAFLFASIFSYDKEIRTAPDHAGIVRILQFTVLPERIRDQLCGVLLYRG